MAAEVEADGRLNCYWPPCGHFANFVCCLFCFCIHIYLGILNQIVPFKFSTKTPRWRIKIQILEALRIFILNLRWWLILKILVKNNSMSETTSQEKCPLI
jgi:hypothetical protein